MTKFVLFDLDGTLSDDRHRRYHAVAAHNGDKRAWNRYHQMAAFDDPVNLHLLDHHCRLGQVPLFVTARPEEWRPITAAWLLRWVTLVLPEHRLLMRAREMSSLSSSEVKDRLLTEYPFQPGDHILHAYDDNPRVLDMYNSRGISTTLIELQYDAPF